MNLKQLDELNRLRRLVTQPTLKTQAEAAQAFSAYLTETYGTSDLEDERIKAMLARLTKHKAAEALFKYMKVM